MSKKTIINYDSPFGIDFSKNPEQRELLTLINKDWRDTPYVFCFGNAGTGKTFTALAGALNKVMNEKDGDYDKIFFCREPVEVGRSLGFLPGDLNDKYGVYLDGLTDNLSHIAFFAKKAGMAIQEGSAEDYIDNCRISSDRKARYNSKKKYDGRDGDKKHVSNYAAKGRKNFAVDSFMSHIECQPPQFMRGRSFQNCIIIVDEAQNLPLDTLHMLMTRAGQYTKMVFLGSTNQIDSKGMTSTDNDFEIAYNLAKELHYAEKVTLTKSERSEFSARMDDAFLKYEQEHPAYKRGNDKNTKRN